MNNMLKRLLVTALAISAAHVSAHTNKNFLSSPRAQAASMLGESHLTRNLCQAKGMDRFGGNFLVSGFYSESRNAKALGKYFGVGDKDSFKAAWNSSVGTDGDINAGYMIHEGVAGHGIHVVPSQTFATLNLAPKTISYGAEFAYKQCLGKVLEGLHLSIALPVERVENNMGLTVTNAQSTTAAATPAVITSAVQDFFAGKLNPTIATLGPLGSAAGNTHGQNKLTKALMNGKQTATGIADINVVLGYDFVRGGDWKAGLNLGLVIPTGNSATGQYVFEPIYGNGNHWELGFGGAVDGFLWRDGDQSIELHVSADYRYGFKANETRTLGGKVGATQANWGQYYLAVADGVVLGQTAAPLANTITQAIGVTPGSALRGNLGLEYDNGGFLFGLNYAPAWKQAESGSVNVTVPAGVAIVSPEAAAMHAALAVGAATSVLITKDNLDMDQALRPSQLAHRLGGNLGYTFKDMDYPITIGVGGHYEFAGDNAVAENWGVNLSAGIGF